LTRVIAGCLGFFTLTQFGDCPRSVSPVAMLRHQALRAQTRPADLVRFWWDHERCLPWPTSQLAFEAYKAGKKPGHLYKGPPWKAKFAVIDGGKSLIAGKTST
jgi:hypothetical protein